MIIIILIKRTKNILLLALKQYKYNFLYKKRYTFLK